MLIFDKKEIRTLSLLGSHRTFGQVALSLPEVDKNAVIVVADQCSPAGLEMFRDKFSDKFYNVGIAEQNMLGVAAGLAKEGFKPYVVAQATFATGRCFDQIKINMGYMGLGVKIVGLSSGLAIGTYGATHMSIEDIAIMRTIPNMTILSPADCVETAKAIIEAAKNNNPTYIRLSGWMNNPIVYNSDYDFEIGKAITIKEGEDISIIATGSMVYNCLKASKIIEEKGFSAKIINMHTIKPLDINAIRNSCNSKLIVTVEEHSKIGGLGSAVAEVLAEIDNASPLLMIGISDEYKKAGDYQYLLEEYNLTPKQIAESILLRLEGENSVKLGNIHKNFF